MSFGGGGFGGFGSTSNNTGGFGSGGGFGSNNNNNNTSGFGSTNSPFGQSNSGGSLFGGANNTTSTPFGSGGGFGSTSNTTAFGSKPFGASTGTGLFGGGGTTSGSTFGGGGFGSTANNTSSAFGSSNTGGGLFGQNKTGFGSTNTTGGGMFGGSSNTTGGFGSTNTGGFGSSAGGAFGQGGTQTQANNGTGTTPFSAWQEKDAGGQQQYQTITFISPYQGYSLEELRVADYNQGRRYGNQNGQAGAFGQSTGFGGFNSTNNNATSSFGASNSGGGLFGNNNNSTSTPFGQTNNNNTTFGSQANSGGGGLFGGNKPGGLFGSTPTTQSNTGGGIFGTSNTNTNTGGAFGSGGTSTGFGSSTSGGGLFGGQNNQSKPAFGGFGASTTNNATGAFGSTNTGFGSANNNTNTSGGGLFGQSNQNSTTGAFGAAQNNNSTGGLFGNNSNTNTNTGGLFGSQNNQPQAQTGGGLFGGGSFGAQNNQQNQPKPGGLFGNTSTTNTGGGLFGQQNNQTPASGGLFGNANANQNSGGLFGNKPAATGGGGLFGNANTQNNTAAAGGGGLFGNLNSTPQNNTQNSLFGNSQNQPKTGGLFGNTAPSASTGGGGLFGGMQNNNQPASGSSLFGSTNQQQQNQQPLNSSFGSSLLQTSMNTNPYGNDALFANLQTPTQSPGPLATPLSSSQKNRRSAILPQHKLNPAASTRLLTPQNKRPGGYGFTYSTYGTPNSVSSNASPGFASSLYGNGSLSRSLGKSLSTSNLRNSMTPEMSILAPGAFSSNGRSFATGSLKKLNINRNINNRPSLFDEPKEIEPKEKRVSFAGPSNGSDRALTNGAETNGINGNELVVREEANGTAAEGSSSRAATTANGTATNGGSDRPEMSQVNGSDLTSVPENLAVSRTSAAQTKQGSVTADPAPGQYWSQPNMEELRKMTRSELMKVKDFVVGRDKIGEIRFHPESTVDLSATDLDKLYGDIVQLTTRNATVYGDTCTVHKPAQGSGLNHPSQITLANSWPRNKHGKRDQKHLERLKRVAGTTFKNYIPETGEWVFTVPHFSSYGLDYDGEAYSDEDNATSELSAPPDTPAQLRDSQMTGTPDEDSLLSTQSSPDDTFDFKKGRSKRASVPGGFGDQVAYEEEADDAMDTTGGESFLGDRSVGSLDGQQDADYSEESESESVEDQDMASPVSGLVQATEPPAAASTMPRSILKNSQILRPGHGTPLKGPMVFEDDWAQQLQRTVSPKKQDRQALRESQGDALRDRDMNIPTMQQSTSVEPIWDRVQLMESMFGTAKQGNGAMEKRAGHGIELPYSKRPKTAHDLDEMSRDDRDFHACNKPHFDESNTLVYATKGVHSLEHGVFATVREPIAGADRDIRFTQLPTFSDAAPPTLDVQKEFTEILTDGNVPRAQLKTDPVPIEFEQLSTAVALDSASGKQESKAWQLLSLLFDDQEDPSKNRKEKLSEFWQDLVHEDAERHVAEAGSDEERAIAYLSGYNVPDACRALVRGLDLNLATMVAQIGSGPAVRLDMQNQMEEWNRLDIVSEMGEPIRAIYELLAGNCARSEGKFGPGRENKTSTFCISSRFGLDWRRAFGLRLWYGTFVDEPLELAIAQFADSIRDGYEEVKPLPWFIEQGNDMGWRDPNTDAREDILWGILKLYAAGKLDVPTNVEDVLAPENVSGNPFNARFSFQLFQLLKSRYDDAQEEAERRVAMPTVRYDQDARQSFMSSTATRDDMDQQAGDPLVELGDKLTLTYAASLHTQDHWLTAIYAYAHLSSPAMREHYMRLLLERFSKTYSIAESDPTYKHLTSSLHIPTEWIHAAAALQAKHEGDYTRQVNHLIKAGEREEAHNVLRHQVAPKCIISREYDALREPLGDLNPTPPSSPALHKSFGRRDPPEGWLVGGQIYYNYIALVDLTSRQSRYRVDEDLDKEIDALLSELASALEIVARQHLQTCELEERVALMEIAGHVAELMAKSTKNHAKVLKLPLTEDLWLKHSVNLSTGYYRAIMAVV